jgi:hypothetical protein
MPLINNEPWAPEFRPILQAGQSARLIRASGQHADVECTGVFPLGVHRHAFNATSGPLLNQQCEHLEMGDSEMGQWRYIPRTNFQVSLQLPSGVDIMRTNRSVPGSATEGMHIPPDAGDTNELEDVRRFVWQASEFLVLQDTTPRFDLHPMQEGEITPILDLHGFGFVLKPASKMPPVTLWLSRPSGTGKL